MDTADRSHTTTAQSDEELFDATMEAIRSFNPMLNASMLNTSMLSNPTGSDTEEGTEDADATRHPSVVEQLTAAMVAKPGAALRRSTSLAVESTRIALGLSDIDLTADRRFRHEKYESNPILRRMGQQYLAWRESVHGYIDDLQLETGAERQSHFLADLITETLAPTNTLAGNPGAVQEAIETKGRSLQQGFQNWLNDQVSNGGMPSMVDTEPFTIGETIAATPGEVIFRSEVLELIRYTPTTAKVHKRPIVIVPPQINKYYILDLAPGRSVVEALVAEGQQVFMVSWRNVTAEQRHWDMGHYVSSLLEAIDVARDLTKQDTVNLLGVCAGGITMSALMGYLAAIGEEKVNSLSYLVTGLDWGQPTLLASMVGGDNASAVVQRSQAAGMLSGRDLSQLFAFLRPNDLVWNYWVNNYLMGKKPPAFDVLAWNVDATNMPAGLHADFMAIAAQNTLAEPGAFEVLGERIDLGEIAVDAYVVGGETDHITPWETCLSTVDMLGGDTRFVLCKSGHVQTIVCPPENPKAKYMAVDGATDGSGADEVEGPITPDSWLDAATEHNGSWWTDWFQWLGERSDGLVNAPKRLDSKRHPTLGAAPGTYVHETA